MNNAPKPEMDMRPMTDEERRATDEFFDGYVKAAAELHAFLDKAGCESVRKEELAELRADKARLDWLELTAEGVHWQLHGDRDIVTRKAIDAAIASGAK